MTCNHIYYVYRGRRLTACDCRCQTCHNGLDCTCTDCSHDPEVHINPDYYNEIKREDERKLGPPKHTCRECGVEVFRNGNRGRFPVRCPECR